ncbi:hypothetical protein AU489_05890 [Lonsdalea populi]|uniref:Uncharacterized protein n=2 Tax=Lonsdalea TaxID=1082702 RepID=A0ACD1JAA0_9GAMM|nr:hypothetical protein AU485_12745 [Lonsdalea quercina]RAT18661.1 hypothetical protein AU487_13640 [Lonsdalea populi]RAT25941.1 hypothetical protein AU489_05890 [Lonsdalea populi]RAT27188.1 hypothetical protein AU488_02685 [Lonsdalea populi]RAT33071.1 hypothetical protein AU492_11160 [Lonsdalea populi]
MHYERFFSAGVVDVAPMVNFVIFPWLILFMGNKGGISRFVLFNEEIQTGYIPSAMRSRK